MSNPIFSILLVLIGLFVGIIAMMILNSIKTFAANKKAQEMMMIYKKYDIINI